MKLFDISRTTFKVVDFLSWQKDGRLTLSPVFQRRPVWSDGQKSYLVDTVVRGLPIPVIFIRDRIDLSSKDVTREVVDGQQRLRTLISFIDPSALPDFDAERDAFLVKPSHNPEIAGMPFGRLPEALQQRILAYEFSTHVLPLDTEDREVLQIFARMNSTGLKLNHQELRNAQWFGPFKTLMYELALEQLDRWRAWRVFNDDQNARMREVEVTSDLCMNAIDGLTGRSQARLDKIYKRFDEEFPQRDVVAERFRHVMDVIDRLLGSRLPRTVYRSEVNFFSLFVFVYDTAYGLGSELKATKARAVGEGMSECLVRVSDRIRTADVPATVLDAIQRASADTGRRRTRLQFMRRVCDAQSTSK
jgi:hypothetical protein